MADDIRRAVEGDGDSSITDLHIWKVAAGHYAAIVSAVACEPKTAAAYHELLKEREELVHITVEEHRRHDEEAEVVEVK